MDVRIEKTAIITFRLNEHRGTADDETEQYLTFINFLASESIPFATARLGFVGNDTDDCYQAVRISVEDYTLLMTAYMKLEEEKRS